MVLSVVAFIWSVPLPVYAKTQDCCVPHSCRGTMAVVCG